MSQQSDILSSKKRSRQPEEVFDNLSLLQNWMELANYEITSGVDFFLSENTFFPLGYSKWDLCNTS